MKLLLGILICLSLTGVAAHAAKVSIPKDKLVEYGRATRIVIDQTKFKCNSTNSGYGSWDMIIYATSGEIDTEGAQPLLYFKTEKPNSLDVVSVTTSADFKSIVSVQIDNYKEVSEYVNSGSMRDPSVRVETAWKANGQVLCVPEKN